MSTTVFKVNGRKRMKKFGIILLCLNLLTAAEAGLTPETILSHPRAWRAAPRQLCWSPDDSLLAFLWNETGGAFQDIYLAAPASGTVRQVTHFVEEEQSSAPQQIQYLQWLPGRSELLFTYQGVIYTSSPNRSDSLSSLAVTSADDPQLHISPDGRYITFLRKNALIMIDIQTGQEHELIDHCYGSADDVDPLQVFGPLATSYSWSHRTHQIALPGSDKEQDISLQILEIPSHQSRSITLFPTGSPQVWIRDIIWTADDHRIALECLQTDLKYRSILMLNLTTNRIDTLFEETHPFVLSPFGGQLFFARNGRKLLFGSEKNGYRHLYWADVRKKYITPLTRGKWHVREYTYNSTEEQLFFSGTKDNPGEVQVYTLDQKTGETVNISFKKGSHRFCISNGGTKVALVFSSLTTPPGLYWSETLPVSKMNPLIPSQPITDRYPKKPPEIRSIYNTQSGRDILYQLWYPEGSLANQTYPLLIALKENESEFAINNRWQLKQLIYQWISEQGYIVAAVEYRPLSQLSPIGAMTTFDPLQAQLEDIQTVITALSEYSYVDRERIGLLGWNYGGYLGVMGLLKMPRQFRSGVAILARTAETEFNPSYHRLVISQLRSSPISGNTSPEKYALNLSDHLLLIQGKRSAMHPLFDTTDFTPPLIAERKPVDFLIYSWEGECFRRDATHIDILYRIHNFLKENL